MKFIATISFDVLVEATDPASCWRVANKHAEAEARIVPAKALSITTVRPYHPLENFPVGWKKDDEPLTLLVNS